MIKIELAKPVCTLAQIHEAANALKIDENEIRALACGAKCVVTDNTKNFQLEDMDSYGWKGDIVCHKEEEWEKQCALSGAEGLVWLCEEHGYTSLIPITTIEIPVDVSAECDDMQWQSICYFTGEVENWNDRLQKLIELDAPQIKLCDVYRMLWQSVQRLESNTLGEPVCWKNGRIMLSLNDIGYSLTDGWLDEDYLEDTIAEADMEEA